MTYENDVFLRSTAAPTGNDVWMYDPTVYSMGAFAAMTLVSGDLVQNPSAGGTDLKIYLASGGLYARTLPSGGAQLVNLSSGVTVAA